MIIRSATEADVPQILKLIKHLAEYEKLAHEVVATEEKLTQTLFGEKSYAEVLMAEAEDGNIAGFALFFHNYSTFLGQPGIYLEDLCVLEEYRGQGIGMALLKRLAKLCVERDCGRLEWSVLDWNVDAIRFYEAHGATLMKEWITNRVTGESLEKLAAD